MDSIAEAELVVLNKIRSIYRELLNELDFEYYLTREAELEQCFSQVYLMESDVNDSKERKGIIRDIYQMNTEIMRFVQDEKNKLESQNRLLYSYSPTIGSVFFDKKG